MRFDLFEQMTTSDAQNLLKRFRQDGASNVDKLLATAAACGVAADYGVGSLPEFLHWAFSHIRTVPVDVDRSVPEWIRSTPEYARGLFDFDDESKNLICLTAYYLGECFVRNYPQLSWAIGKPDFAEANMPVLTGFRQSVELAPLLVVENLFRRISQKPDRSPDIETAIEAWQGYLE